MSRLSILDIANLPAAEDEQFEYKSSLVPLNTLKDKLARAASGFWNSGGGLFIAGVDGAGKPDGGIAIAVGRQALRDWADQVIQEVSPVGKYSVRLIAHDPASGLNIDLNKCVIAVEFEESPNPPHMAPDRKYYIRAGAHTVPATHYIVEALWTRRRHQRPQLAHTLRLKPEASDIIQLALLPLTEEPAINVTVTLDPLPEMWKDSRATFPVRLPVLDRTTPFYLDVTTYFAGEERLGKGVQLRVEYEDLGKNRYEYTGALDIKSIAPWKIGTPASEKMAKSLESIDKTLQKIPDSLNKLHEENAELRSRLEAWKSSTFTQPVGEPMAIASELGADARTLLLAAKTDGAIVFSPYIGGSQLHAGKTQFIANQLDEREEAKWKHAVSELRNRELIDGVFRRGVSCLFRLTHLGFEVAEAIRPPPSDGAESKVEGGG
jgi:hypothetical protein